MEGVVRSQRNAPPFSLQSCDSWMIVKENPGRKKKYGFEFGLTKYDFRQSYWQKMNFKEIFLNIFDFSHSILLALFKRWVTDKLTVKQTIFTSYFLLYSIVHYYTQLKETLWDQSFWQQPLGKTLNLQHQNEVITHVFRKTKSSTWHVLFLPAKLMLQISYLFLYSVEITCWHSYTLPKEDPKNIWITWHTPWVLLTSVFFHRKPANFAISKNTDIDCILIHNFQFF